MQQLAYTRQHESMALFAHQGESENYEKETIQLMRQSDNSRFSQQVCQSNNIHPFVWLASSW